MVCCLASCDSYLDIVPKGSKIPSTLADYEAMLRYEYGIGQTPMYQSYYLLNDYYVKKSSLSSNTLTTANYMWDETADRITLNNEDESAYYYLYGAISTCNLLVEYVPSATECTDAERNEVISYAKVIRAICYFNLVNYYADTYEASTASTKLGVPYITSAAVDAPSTQLTIQEIYDNMIADVKDALAGGLPKEGQTIIHPNRGAAYALLARIYLQMSNYSEALSYAEKALGENSTLYDWNSFYDQYATQIEDPTSYTSLPAPNVYTYPENYYFRCGANSPNYTSAIFSIPVERAERFEDGDAQFLSTWKLRTVNQDTYYTGIISGYFNKGGLTTAEVYLIKAECQARLGNIDEAMETLDQVRQNRIRPDKYQPSTATSLADAIDKIRTTKDNEMIFTIVPFADARRFNAEGTYARTMTKEYDGKTYTLSPTSHLWTMPFPAGATGNPGNGTITQNVEK